MRSDLYQDILDKEEKHWWHLAKKELVKTLSAKYIKKFTQKDKVLDLGCGTGLVLQSLNSKARLYGIDNTAEALKICRKKGIKNVKKGNVEKLGFKKEQFSLVTMFDVLEHTEEKKSISEVSRVLKKGGLIFITVPAYQWMWSRWDEILGHHKRYTKADLESLLENNNFKLVKTSYFYTFIFPLAAAVRKIKNMLSNKDYSTDFTIPNELINRALFSICKLEIRILQNLSLPFGLSVIAVAKKK